MKKRTYQASDTTKREICAALKGLMAQKPLTKISVTEIMRACGMARQHFYYHFEDIYDAVRWMFEEEAVALLREHEGVTRGRTACSGCSNISKITGRSVCAPCTP